MPEEQTRKKLFHEWLNRYQAMLFKIVRAYASHPADQDDIFQEICLQIWLSLPGFRAESQPSTWLYRIALRTALTWRKQGQRQREQMSNYQATILKPTQEPKDERLEWLLQMINRFNKIDRSLAILLLDGFSYQEMAQILGISESNVGVKLHRIKKRLAEWAAKEYRNEY